MGYLVLIVLSIVLVLLFTAVSMAMVVVIDATVILTVDVLHDTGVQRGCGSYSSSLLLLLFGLMGLLKRRRGA